jgi:hypothetical protein
VAQVPPDDDPSDLEEAQSRVSPAVYAALAAALVLTASDPTWPTLPVAEAATALAEAMVSMGLATGVTGVLAALGASTALDHGMTTPSAVSTAASSARSGGGAQLVRSAQGFVTSVVDAGIPLPTALPTPEQMKDIYGADLPRTTRGVAQAARNSGVYAAAVASGHTHKTWHSRNDNRVRPTHNVLDSHAWPEHTVSIEEPFQSPSGAEIMFPGDPLAPLDEQMNCRCWVTFSTPKFGKPYGETAEVSPSGYHPPEMQGNPLAPPKNAPPVGVRWL